MTLTFIYTIFYGIVYSEVQVFFFFFWSRPSENKFIAINLNGLPKILLIYLFKLWFAKFPNLKTKGAKNYKEEL